MILLYKFLLHETLKDHRVQLSTGPSCGATLSPSKRWYRLGTLSFTSLRAVSTEGVLKFCKINLVKLYLSLPNKVPKLKPNRISCQ